MDEYIVYICNGVLFNNKMKEFLIDKWERILCYVGKVEKIYIVWFY